MTLKVALLKGGWNSERDVSLSSAKGIVSALQKRDFDVFEIDVTRDLQSLIDQLSRFNPDVVCLNALHGRYVEDGMIQGVMEILGYSYTGSNATASAIAFDKGVSRSLFKEAGIRIPEGEIGEAKAFFAQKTPEFLYPFVVKPLNEGSSVGVSIIHTDEDFQKAADQWKYGTNALVETYIPGRELSVALMNDKPLGVLELCPKKGFYDYKAKYTEGLTKHIMPADLSSEDYSDVMEMAQKAAKTLGVSGVSRADIRFDDQRPLGKRSFVLEMNTLPGMTSLSIVPEIAAYAGIDYETLCEWMVKNPICPQEKLPKEKPSSGKKQQGAKQRLVQKTLS